MPKILICDGCGQPINSHDEAMVEWVEAHGEQPSDVRVVHNASVSPFKPSADCYKHTRAYHRCDNHLDVILSIPGEVDRLGIRNRIYG